MKLKTLKDLDMYKTYKKLLKQEAIKWVKEDLENIKLTNDFGDTLWKPINIIMDWMKRFNITEEDLI